ncbi:MAG: hypothetical protein DI539_12450 [Flavobacterium psychrophilum]|nr:MAG: hypothetical protein DI539_12450 [Flavobacterium psychrophilum]
MSDNYLIAKEYTDVVFGDESIMYKDFERCSFTNCDFSSANFTGVAFIDCTFTGCNFYEAKINYVAFRGALFTDCDFNGVNFSMVDPLLFEIEFKDCLLDYSKFYTLKIKGTTFTNCSLIAVDFMSTDLTGVMFDNCNLHKAVFIDAIANKADFTTSYNFSIDPERNKLKKAMFSQAGLKGLLDKYDIIVK